MGKRQAFIDALATLGDGRYTYDGVGGCSRYVRLALKLADIITQEQADNAYILWAAQCYRSLLRNASLFMELPSDTEPIEGDILWYHGAHVAVYAGGNYDIYEAAPEGSHGICENGKTGVGLWKNHTYNCAGKALTCIYRIIEDEEVTVKTEKLITSAELVNTAIDICMGKFGPTGYWNAYPWNVGKWDGQKWWWDCLGFVHTLVNGFKGDTSVLGGGAIMDDFVNCCDEAATLNSCDYISAFNGTEPKKGSLIQSSGHVGIYIGTYEVKRDNGVVDVYNTAECTPVWAGGAQLSWTDISNGNRFNKKNGDYRSTWNYFGELSRVNYIDDTQNVIAPEIIPEDIKTITPVQKLMTAAEVINGSWGVNPSRKNKLTELYGNKVAVQIQELVNITFNCDIDTLTPVQKLTTAIDVINGKYGNGIVRKEELISAYGNLIASQIQELVNKAFE